MSKISVLIESDNPKDTGWLATHHIRNALVTYVLDKEFRVADFTVTKLEIQKGDVVK